MQTLYNGVEVFTNGDPYNLADDVAHAFATANLVIDVSSQAQRDGLAAAAPAGVLPVPTFVARMDLPGAPIQTWNGSTWTGGDTGWINVPLINGFTNFNTSGWTGLKYRIRDGWVTVNGAVERGTSWVANTVCGTLPVEARPAYRVQGSNVQVDNTQGYLIMSAAGPGGYALSATYPLG